MTTQLPDPSAITRQLTSLFLRLGCGMIYYVSQYTICTRTVCVNSSYIKRSISLKRSLDRPRTSTVLEHSYYLTDVLHVNFEISSVNLICIDLHGKLKIAMTSCPPSSGYLPRLLILTHIVNVHPHLITFLNQPIADEYRTFLRIPLVANHHVTT